MPLFYLLLYQWKAVWCLPSHITFVPQLQHLKDEDNGIYSLWYCILADGLKEAKISEAALKKPPTELFRQYELILFIILN